MAKTDIQDLPIYTIGEPDPRKLPDDVAEDFFYFIGKAALEYFKDPEKRREAEEWKAQKRAEGWDWCV